VWGGWARWGCGVVRRGRVYFLRQGEGRQGKER